MYISGEGESVVIEIGEEVGVETISTQVQTGTETTVTYDGCSSIGSNPISYATNTGGQGFGYLMWGVIPIPGATASIQSGDWNIGLNPGQMSSTQGFNNNCFTTIGELGGVQDCNFDSVAPQGTGNVPGTSSQMEFDYNSINPNHKLIRYRGGYTQYDSGNMQPVVNGLFQNWDFKGGAGATPPWDHFQFNPNGGYSFLNSWMPKGHYVSKVVHGQNGIEDSLDGMSFYFVHASTFLNQGGQIHAYSFDIAVAAGNHIFFTGNGTDASSELAEGPLHPATSSEYFGYISPFQHNGYWSEIRNQENELTFSGQAAWSKCMSYYGAKTNSSSSIPFNISPCYDIFEHYLGMRHGAFFQDHDDWKISFTVTTISAPFELHVLQGTPLTGAISGASDIAMKINSPGTYEICLPALRMQFESDPDFNEVAGMMLTGDHGLAAAVPNGAMLFNVKVDDSYDGSTIAASVLTIADLKLEKVKGEYTTTTTPTYSDGSSYDIKTYDWNRLDVLDNEISPLSLNYSMSDLRDIKKKTVGFSRTFKIPANKHNESVLGSMIGVGAEREMIDWMKARVLVNGLVVFKGLLRVEQSSTGKGGSYKCHIIQDNITWTGSMGDNTICNLPLIVNDDPLTGAKEEKNYENVIKSWDNTTDNSDYFFGVANYGEWWSQAANGTYDHGNKDFHPFIFTKSIIDKIFEQTGYIVTSDFFNSAFFKGLCHPYSSGEDYTDTADMFNSDGKHYVHATKASADKWGIADGSSSGPTHFGFEWPLIGNPGNNYSAGTGSGNGYIVPFTGTYDIYARAQVDVTPYSYVCAHANRSYCWLQITRNGSVIDGFSFTQSGSNIFSNMGGGNHVDCYQSGYKQLQRSGQLVCQAGDIIHMSFYAENYTWYCDHKNWIKDIAFDVYPVPSSIVPPAPCDLTKVLPCVKQVDFIQGLTEMFNLQWLANEEQKTIHVEPYDDFYGTGELLDWSDKIDHREWTDKFIIEELAKLTVFKYKLDSSDGGMEFLYKWRLENGYEELYNAHYEDNGLKFRKEEQVMGTKVFHNTWDFNFYDQAISAGWGWGDMSWLGGSDHNNPLMAAMWTEGGGINNESRQDYTPFPGLGLRILNYYGKESDVSSWKYVDENGGSHTKPHYPHSGVVNGYAKRTGNPDPYCLTWQDYDHHNSSVESPGLFTKFWQRAYRMMNGGSAMRTCLMNLNANDMSKFDYRNLILLTIKGVSTYWTVNKIIDYTPGSKELTKVELIEYKEKVNTRKRRGENGGGKAKLGGGKEISPIEGISIDFQPSNLAKNQEVINKAASNSVLGTIANSAVADLENMNQNNGEEIFVEEDDGTIHDLMINDSYQGGELDLNTTKKVTLPKESPLGEQQTQPDPPGEPFTHTASSGDNY